MPAYEFPRNFDTAGTIANHPEFAGAARLVPLTSATITLSRDVHDGRTMLFDKAAGVTVTLPAAIGSGAKFLFKVKSLATSNSYIVKVANSSDIMQGIVSTTDTDTAGTVTGWATAADSDTITLNRSTTGSAMIGEWLELEDIVKNTWAVRGQLSNTGSGATPFSATV